ncbi:MAG: hypothetical protein SGBAC_001623 [Bacillariaceae sp.]
MQFHSPTNTQPELTRKVTPSPKLRKIQIDNDSPRDVKQFVGKGKDYVQLIQDCKSTREFGKLMKWNGKIFRSATCLSAVLRKLDEIKLDFCSRDVAILLNVFANSRSASEVTGLYRAILTSLADVALATLHEANAKDVSMTLHALVKRNIRNTQLFQEAAERGIAIMDDFNPEGLSNMLEALAVTKSYSYEFFDRAAKAAISMMFNDDFNSQSICFVADAFARTKHYDAELFAAMAKKAIPFLDTFRPQDLVLLIDAFANSEHEDCDDLFDEASETIADKIHYFNTEGLVRLVRSFAKAGYEKSFILDAIAEKEIQFLHTLDARPLSQLLLAFVDMHYIHEELFQTAMAAVTHRMPSYDPAELITMASTFSKVKRFSGVYALFAAAAEAAELILDSFQPREVAKLMAIFARMEAFSESSDHLFCMIASLIISDSNDPSLDRWDSRYLVDVAVAFAKGGVTNSNLLEVIGRTIVERGDLFPRTASTTKPTTLQRLLIAFCEYETPSAVLVMELLFREFMSLDSSEVESEIEISLVMDIAKALPFGQRNDILPYGILKQISDIALTKGTKEEVFTIFQIFYKLGLEEMVVPSKKPRSGARGSSKDDDKDKN